MVQMRTGRVVGGVIVLDDDEPIPEGVEVRVFTKEPEDEQGFDLRPEEEAELGARIEAVREGEFVEGDVVVKKLRRSLSSS